MVRELPQELVERPLPEAVQMLASEAKTKIAQFFSIF